MLLIYFVYRVPELWVVASVVKVFSYWGLWKCEFSFDVFVVVGFIVLGGLPPAF